jgi:hypothetical protein
MVAVERLDFLGEKWITSSMKCPLCPRDDDEGSLYLAADGCFSLGRLKQAGGPTTRESNLNGLFFHELEGEHSHEGISQLMFFNVFG